MFKFWKRKLEPKKPTIYSCYSKIKDMAEELDELLFALSQTGPELDTLPEQYRKSRTSTIKQYANSSLYGLESLRDELKLLAEAIVYHRARTRASSSNTSGESK